MQRLNLSWTDDLHSFKWSIAELEGAEHISKLLSNVEDACAYLGPAPKQGFAFNLETPSLTIFTRDTQTETNPHQYRHTYPPTTAAYQYEASIGEFKRPIPDKEKYGEKHWLPETFTEEDFLSLLHSTLHFSPAQP